jgi:hypothetical protein
MHLTGKTPRQTGAAAAASNVAAVAAELLANLEKMAAAA